ncbi:MAG: J domain-containing protein [Roseburia sp.]|nr:J domain-containing protein [Roseburia sp.]
MNINEVWELLEIEPTSDKKLIKQAYARAVKKYHPEENPQEFQKVYAAYKQAIAMAGKPGGGQTVDAANLVYQMLLQGQYRQETLEETKEKDISREILVETEEEDKGQESFEEQRETVFRSGEEEQIHKMFREMADQREKKLSIFRCKWLWYLKNQGRDDAEKEMREYMQSAWFKDIMEEPEVLSRLVTGIDMYCQNYGGALKEDIWQLYSLGDPKTQEDKNRHRTLFHVLEADRERLRIKQRREAAMHRRMIQSQTPDKNLKLHRAWKALGKMLVVLIALISVFAGIGIYFHGSSGGKIISQEEEQAEIFSYLQETYPMADFSQPEPFIEATEAQYADADLSGRNYRVKEKNFDITVNVYTVYKDGTSYIGEDFGRQYMRQLGEKWGLICDLCRVEEPWTDGKTHSLMLGGYEISPDLSELRGELREYMERFREFAKSEEVREFVNIDGVSFCVSNCFCPKAFLMEAGGVPKPLLYDLEELPESEVMAEDMAECITDYYIHMEPWQLEHDPLYDEWLSSYEQRVKEMDLKPSTPAGSAAVMLAEELEVQVVPYTYRAFEWLSLGDLYRMAKKSGHPTSVLADGSGFTWKNGCSYKYDGTGDDLGYTCESIVEIFAEE